MPQNRESGAQAQRFGREMAKAIAKRLGTECKNPNSNECMYEGKRAVIKCAHQATNDIGVSYKMLDRLDVIIAAFEDEPDCYELFEFDPEHFRENMRPTRSKGPAADRVGLVRKSTVIKEGTYLCHLDMSTPGT